jgi:hypothetical protein
MNARSYLFPYAKCLEMLDLVEYYDVLELGFLPVM